MRCQRKLLLKWTDGNLLLPYIFRPKDRRCSENEDPILRITWKGLCKLTLESVMIMVS